MARIRTVKPELWSDPEFVECSTNARLLFVAALNFASDYGVLADKPKQLKMQCFPGDTFDVDQLVDELIEARLWVRRIAPDGASVLLIRTFAQHQRVDKPNGGRWGDPAEWPCTPPDFPDPSPNGHGTLDERSENVHPRKGREGKGMEGSKNTHARNDERAPSLELVVIDDTPSLPSAAGFERFWQTYPRARRVARSRAERVWSKMRTPERIQAVEMIAQHALAWQAMGTEARYIPHPATWLNGGNWREPLTVPEHKPTLTRSNQAVANAIANHIGGTA